MASVDINSNKRVSKYQVDVDAIDRILNKLEDGLNEADIIFVDEIGKMELYSQRFKDTIEGILDSNKTVIATIQLSENPFIKNIMKREDSKVCFLERDNQIKVLKSIKNEVNQH
jgi:nucleoside-triphosphatase